MRYIGEMGAIPGQPVEVAPEWIEMVKRRMDELGIDQLTISKATGIDTGTLSRFLNPPRPGHHVSKYVNTIADYLGVPRPVIYVRSSDEAAWHELGVLALKMPREDYEKLLMVARKFIAARVSLDDAEKLLLGIMPTSQK